MTEFRLVILTPDREWHAGPAEGVTAPGAHGEFGVLARHIPLVAGLRAGVVRVRKAGGQAIYFAVDGGVLGVDARGEVRILAGQAAACPDGESARRAAAAYGRAPQGAPFRTGGAIS